MIVADPARLEGTLARLRDNGVALRERPADEVLGSLARLFDAFADHDSPAREALASVLPATTGFSAEMVREGLARGFDSWTGAALRELAAAEMGGTKGLASTRGFDVAAVVLAGAIPMPVLLSVAAPLLLRTPVLVKPSRHDPVSAGIVRDTLASIDTGLADCLESLRFEGELQGACLTALCGADAIEVNGSDATVATVRAQARDCTVIAHGHKLSVAALGPEAGADACERLALDIALWDQLGCLSPIAVYPVGTADPSEALAEALTRAEACWPRGRTPLASVAAAERELDQARMRGAKVLSGRTGSFNIVRELDAVPRLAPLHRFLRIHPVADADALLDALRPLQPHLACVALEGLGSSEPALATACAELGASRVCAPGEMQSPPLGWRRGGRGVLEPWVRP